MEGANDGYFAIRMKSDIIHWPKDDNGNWTEEKYCREPGTYCGVILLISTENAEPLAFINDGALQHMRVGGGAGLGVKYLARKDSHVVGMLGSGGMARTFLEAFKSVRDIRQCRVYSPTPEHREAFAEEMSKRLNIEVIAVDNPHDAVKGSDILSSCTDAMNPVYDADWIEPGMHVTNLGRREMPDASGEKFDVVIRQGTAGLQMKMSERFQAERGLSPAAYLGGTVEEMKRIPEKNPEPGFGGDDPDFKDRGKGGTYPDFADLVSGKARGPHQPRPGHVLPQRRQPGAPVLRGRPGGLPQMRGAEARPRNSDRMVSAGHSRLSDSIIRQRDGGLPRAQRDVCMIIAPTAEPFGHRSVVDVGPRQIPSPISTRAPR